MDPSFFTYIRLGDLDGYRIYKTRDETETSSWTNNSKENKNRE